VLEAAASVHSATLACHFRAAMCHSKQEHAIRERENGKSLHLRDVSDRDVRICYEEELCPR